MNSGWHVVALTEAFLKDCAAAGLSEAEVSEIVEQVSRSPQSGDLIRGSGGARKVRVAGRGKGKSGGHRLITAYFGADAPVYALVLYGKGERSNLSQGEINALRELLSEVKRYWKERKT